MVYVASLYPLTNKISVWTGIHAVPVPRILGWPQGVTSMMLASQNNVPVRCKMHASSTMIQLAI